jgi:hypothetical protein
MNYQRMLCIIALQLQPNRGNKPSTTLRALSRARPVVSLALLFACAF